MEGQEEAGKEGAEGRDGGGEQGGRERRKRDTPTRTICVHFQSTPCSCDPPA